MAEGSIKARIAALNLEEVHTPTPGVKPSYTYDVATTKKKPPPPPPSGRPPAYQRQQTINNPPILSNATTSARHLGNQPDVQESHKISPALPPRPPPRNNTTSNGSTKPSPALPPRRPSDNRSLTRRESTESISTVASGMSSLSLGSTRTGTSNGNGTVYQVRAPAYDPSKLPPLPPKKVEEKSATRIAMQSKRNFVPSQTLPPNLNKSPQLPARPSLPPRQPTAQDRSPERPSLPTRTSTNQSATAKPTRFVAPAPTKSILQMGFNNKPTDPPPVPQNRPAQNNGPAPGAPPPIPLSSRPNLDAIMASKPKPGAVSSCLICRDYSGPDQHAARFPRQQLPSSDVGWLAHQLCDPFPSATDKARAIFVWLHHNIDYDTHSFFNGNIQPSTPERTITHGLAVCEGYAGLFAALALKAGLEALVCSGDSKGFGHRPMEPGDPMPAFDSNHAWNAVKIDNGDWKLLDACWGAGHVGCQLRNEGYIRSFNQAMFTMPNNDFGMAHYPSDNSQQFRTDGRILSFEEFKMDDMGGRVTALADCKESGINERSIYPTTAKIKVYDSAAPAMVRFQFSTYCQHWDNAKHGKGAPYVMLLAIAGRDGRDSQYPPFNFDGHTWWLDVPRLDLGCPGQKIDIRAVTKFNDKCARGLTYQQWNNKKGYSAAFGMICGWELV